MNESFTRAGPPADQRRGLRVSAIYPLEFWVPGLGTSGSGRTSNLGSGGMQFLCAQALEPGTALRVRIQGSAMGRPALELPASVVRCTPRGQRFFAIGCALD